MKIYGICDGCGYEGNLSELGQRVYCENCIRSKVVDVKKALCSICEKEVDPAIMLSYYLEILMCPDCRKITMEMLKALIKVAHQNKVSSVKF